MYTVLEEPRGVAFILPGGNRKAFIQELAFDLGFEGCIGVHQVEKGRTGTLHRKETQRHRDLRGHIEVWSVWVTAGWRIGGRLTLSRVGLDPRFGSLHGPEGSGAAGGSTAGRIGVLLWKGHSGILEREQWCVCVCERWDLLTSKPLLSGIM